MQVGSCKLKRFLISGISCEEFELTFGETVACLQPEISTFRAASSLGRQCPSEFVLEDFSFSEIRSDRDVLLFFIIIVVDQSFMNSICDF